MFTESKNDKVHSPSAFDPPLIRVVSRHNDLNLKLDPLRANENIFKEYLKEKQKQSLANENNGTNHIKINIKRDLSNDNDSDVRIIDDEGCELAVKILSMSMKWVKSLPSFRQLKFEEQEALIRYSWKELFILTAAQWFAISIKGM